MTEELLPFCTCGCDERVSKPRNRFIWGHHRRGKSHTPEACAAMSSATLGVPKPTRTAEHCANLSKALTGRTLSPEHCDAISAGTLGVPKSPRTPEHNTAISDAHTGVSLSSEHCAAMSKAMQESDAVDAMRGGNDLVNHHYIYDHADLSLNTVQMTRKDHGKLHALLRKLGYIVSHVNVPDEDNSEAHEEDL